MRVLWGLVLVCSVSAAARPPARKKASSKVTQRSSTAVDPFGAVTSVTAEAAFLNRGAVDGLKSGQPITFTRTGKQVGKCVIDALSDHYARCTGSGLRLGDRFSVARAADVSPVGPGALPTDAELARRAAAVDQLEWKLRDFDARASRANGVGPRVEVLLSHTTWGNTGSLNGPYGMQRVDVAVYDVDLWKGLRASADVTVLNVSARPDVSHFGSDGALVQPAYPKGPALLVRQLELGFRRADVPISAALGRTWLRSAAGLMVVDGAQAAWRFGEGVEVGAYGGLLPEAARLAITPSQWAVGAFGRVSLSSGTGAQATVGLISLRAGYSQRDVLGGRVEASLVASLWKGQDFDGTASVELGFGQTQAPAGIDAARVDLGWRPSEKLRLLGGVRYRGLPLTGLVELGTVSPGQSALHADLGALYQLNDSFLISAQGGLASDFTSGLLQGRVGPELSMPHVGGLPLGLSLGYAEEFGWLRGRYGYFQANVAPLGLFRVLTRVSWFQQQGSAGSEGLGSHELGGSFALEVTPWRYVNARVLVMGRVPLSPDKGPLGSVGFQLGGAF